MTKQQLEAERAARAAEDAEYWAEQRERMAQALAAVDQLPWKFCEPYLSGGKRL